MKGKNTAVVGLAVIMALAAMWPVLAEVKPEHVVPGKESGKQEVEHPFPQTPEEEELECLLNIIAKSPILKEGDYNVLKGIRDMKVVVLPLRPEIEKRGLTRQMLQTDVELQLRKYGIKVNEFNAPGVTYLYILMPARTYPLYDGFVNYGIIVQFRDLVVLDRFPAKLAPATVWQRAAIGIIGLSKIQQIREQLKDQVNMFINDYLAANPKK